MSQAQVRARTSKPPRPDKPISVVEKLSFV